MKKLAFNFADILQHDPAKGAAAGLGAWMLSIIDVFNPYLQFLALALGVGVAGLTFMLKAIELYKKIKS